MVCIAGGQLKIIRPVMVRMIIPMVNHFLSDQRVFPLQADVPASSRSGDWRGDAWERKSRCSHISLGGDHRSNLDDPSQIAAPLVAGNRCGKTVVGAYETAVHLTGMYPHIAAPRRRRPRRDGGAPQHRVCARGRVYEAPRPRPADPGREIPQILRSDFPLVSRKTWGPRRRIIGL